MKKRHLRFAGAASLLFLLLALWVHAQDPGSMEYWDAGEQPPAPPYGIYSGDMFYWAAEEEPPVEGDGPTATPTVTPTWTPTPTPTPTPTATPCTSAWDDLCVSGAGVVQLSGAYLCATPSIYSFGHWFNDPTPTPGVAYVNHDVPAGDEGDFISCLRPSQLYTTTMEVMRAVEIANTNPCTSTLHDVWRLRYLPAGSADLVCDVCNPVMYYNVGTMPFASWTTFRVDWYLPAAPNVGSIDVYRNMTPVVNASGIGMAAGGSHHQAEAVQVGILDWDQSGRNTWFYSDESYDLFNQETCTPTPTMTATPTPTVTPTSGATNTPTPTPTPGSSPTPTRTPWGTSTPTPHGTPVTVLRASDSFLCECACAEAEPDDWAWLYYGLTCETYYSAPNVAIPDNDAGGITSTITVADVFTITDVNVLELVIDHPEPESLVIYLTSPAAATVILVDNPWEFHEYGGNFDGTSFDDDVKGSIQVAPPPFTGRYRPEPGEFLSDFDGENSAGEWKLRVVDEWASGTGTLVSWQLELCYANGTPTPTPTATPTAYAPTVQSPGGLITPTPSHWVCMVLTPVADAYVDSSNPATNYGAATSLYVDPNASQERWTYLKYDAGGIPSGAEVTRAGVYQYYDARGAALPTYIEYDTTANTWTEGGLTWNNKTAPVGEIRAAAVHGGGSAPPYWYFTDDSPYTHPDHELEKAVATAVAGSGTFAVVVHPRPTPVVAPPAETWRSMSSKEGTDASEAFVCYYADADETTGNRGKVQDITPGGLREWDPTDSYVYPWSLWAATRPIINTDMCMQPVELGVINGGDEYSIGIRLVADEAWELTGIELPLWKEAWSGDHTLHVTVEGDGDHDWQPILYHGQITPTLMPDEWFTADLSRPYTTTTVSFNTPVNLYKGQEIIVWLNVPEGSWVTDFYEIAGSWSYDSNCGWANALRPDWYMYHFGIYDDGWGDNFDAWDLTIGLKGAEGVTRPCEQYGHAAVLNIDDDCEAVLRFRTLPSYIPGGATVTRATLRIYGVAAEVPGETVHITSLNALWGETTADWCRRMVGTDWVGPGAYNVPLDRMPGAIAGFQTALGWIDVELPVGLVEEWALTGAANPGLVFHNADLTGKFSIASREWYEADYRPRIDVWYTD